MFANQPSPSLRFLGFFWVILSAHFPGVILSDPNLTFLIHLIIEFNLILAPKKSHFFWGGGDFFSSISSPSGRGDATFYETACNWDVGLEAPACAPTRLRRRSSSAASPTSWTARSGWGRAAGRGSDKLAHQCQNLMGPLPPTLRKLSTRVKLSKKLRPIEISILYTSNIARRFMITFQGGAIR